MLEFTTTDLRDGLRIVLNIFPKGNQLHVVLNFSNAEGPVETTKASVPPKREGDQTGSLNQGDLHHSRQYSLGGAYEWLQSYDEKADKDTGYNMVSGTPPSAGAPRFHRSGSAPPASSPPVVFKSVSETTRVAKRQKLDSDTLSSVDEENIEEVATPPKFLGQLGDVFNHA